MPCTRSTMLSAGAVAAALFGLAPAAHAAPVALPAHFAAPYLELSDSTAGLMAEDMQATGTNHYTLAFLIPQNGCTAQWEAGGAPVGSFAQQIKDLQSVGGDVIISFGGAEGGELAQTCTSVPDLTAAYANIVDTYGVTRLDFDIEGNTLNDPAANQRRNQALAALQQQNPAVQVDYTLGVSPGVGLRDGEMAVLQDAKSQGVNVSAVDIMAMDFGDGESPLNDGISAAQATSNELAGLYGISQSEAYGRIGITPIAGQNDDNEYFGQDDASTLENFAQTNGLQLLAFWEVASYDKAAGYAYSRIFNQLGGGAS
ncbi:glycosyl hydrolase family 18 protein [Kutzneria sp. CA-103260]|uniref:glycosyl hydrolase family 18 protein n=1 Tax=Kutzneria sp. CA-103260 TaxID=2802641 RepID=UPI001BEF9577|nr:glycosyl hydrolase family 18 protein [Kutzneria sp. CA-103260]QUQ66729.1 sugar hydrolase [Kutzneria sp. CA-103260]